MMRVGFATIGQSPRDDVLAQFLPLMPGIEPIQAGALDDLTPAAIAALMPAPGASVLISRLRDGSDVVLDHERLLPHLERAVARLYADGASAVVLLCTADFPAMQAPGLFLPANAVMRGAVDLLLPIGRVGVVIPLPEQAAESQARFAAPGRAVKVVVASPYAADSAAQVATAGAELAAWQPDLVVLDCLGYAERVRTALADAVTCPIIRPASLIARWVQELSAAAAARRELPDGHIRGREV